MYSSYSTHKNSYKGKKNHTILPAYSPSVWSWLKNIFSNDHFSAAKTRSLHLQVQEQFKALHDPCFSSSIHFTIKSAQELGSRISSSLFHACNKSLTSCTTLFPTDKSGSWSGYHAQTQISSWQPYLNVEGTSLGGLLLIPLPLCTLDHNLLPRSH